MNYRNVLVSLSLLCAAPFSQGAWTATILHPAGATQSVANTALENIQGGYATIADRTRASLWSSTASSWLNFHPNGAYQSAIVSMDGQNQGGYVVYGTSKRAAIWSGTAASFVNLHPAGFTSSYIYGVNGGSQVGGCVSGVRLSAALWKNTVASYVDLSPPGSRDSEAIAVFGNTQVGWETNPGQHAVMWTGSADSAIDLHPDNYVVSLANCVTAHHQGGFAMDGTQIHAALWSGSKESFVDMHPGNFNSHSAIVAMADSIQVGNTRENFLYRACYWNGTVDSFRDLHSTLPAEYTQSCATGVSTDGVNDYISGWAQIESGEKFAVVWTRPAEQAFTFGLNKIVVAGQNSVQGTIRLFGPSTSSLSFATYDNSSLVNTPASVTVPANAMEKNFQITVLAVNAPVNTTIFAKRQSLTRSVNLTLSPLIPTALAFTPNVVTGGQSLTCRVVINGVAGPGGRTISIFDNSAYSTLPSTVVVPAGASEVSFAIETLPVASQRVVTVTARVSAGEKSATFRINP